MTVPAIFVLGMHRSGTSALSRVLGLMGFGQAANLMAPNRYNPSGYWEPKPVVALNDAYLWDMQRFWADPKPFDITEDPQRYQRAVTDAQAVLEQQFDQTNGFVVKDPRASLTFPAWHEAALRVGAKPVVLIALRNPVSVCRSLDARDGIDMDHAEMLWANYTLGAEKWSRDVPRAVVRYEDMLRDWQGTIQAVFARIGLPVPDLTAPQIASVDAFLDPTLNHGEASNTDLSAQAQISQGTKNLYTCLSRPSGLERLEDLDEIQSEWTTFWAQESPDSCPSTYAKRFPDWHLKTSEQALASGDLAGAFAACHAAIDLAPNLAQCHFQLAKLHFDQGQFQDALDPICKAIEVNSDRIHFHMLHARILNQLDRPQEALDPIARALVCNPNWPAAYFLQGTFLLKLDRREDAAEALERAIALDPNKAQYHKALARTQKPRINKAGEARQEKIAQGRRHLRDKDWRAAHDVFAELALKKDVHVMILRNLLSTQLRLGIVQGSIATLERILKRDPTSPDYLFLLGKQRSLAADWAGATQARTAGLGNGLAAIKQFLNTPEQCEGPPNCDVTQALFAWQSAGYRYDQLRALSDQNSGALWPLGPRRPTLEKPEIARIQGANRPELSVMMPVYNVQNTAWLRQAIDSVLGQTSGLDVEVVVVDDASTNDAARDVVAQYGSRVKYTRNTAQLGLLQNHNQCLKQARGAFIHILHQDDWVQDGFYDALLTPLRADPNLAMAFCTARIVDTKDKRLRRRAQLRDTAGVMDNWLGQIMHGQLINFPTVIARRSAYEQVGGFTPSLSFAFDWEMWARLATAGDVWHDPGEFAVYRNHSASATQLFTVLERMIDTFQTVAVLLPLLPEDQADQIGRHALHRVLLNGWQQLAKMQLGAEGLEDMIDFLQKGSSSDTDAAKIMALFDAA